MQPVNGYRGVKMESYTGQQQFNSTDLMSLASGGTGDFQVGNCFITYPYYYPLYEEHYHSYYPSVSYVTEKSKVEQAFKILGKLLEKKIVKVITIGQFIELVNEIASIL